MLPYMTLNKNLHSLHQNWIQFYCHSLQIHFIAIYPSPVYQMLGLLFWRAFCLPSKLTTETMALMEGTN